MEGMTSFTNSSNNSYNISDLSFLPNLSPEKEFVLPYKLYGIRPLHVFHFYILIISFISRKGLWRLATDCGID